MLSNPIIQRYRFSQFRPQQLWTFGALYTCTLLLVFFINASIYSVGQSFTSIQGLYKALFIQFSVLQVILLWLIMPMNCSNFVPREIADKSFVFFRMLPLSASQKAIGILVGRNLFSILIAAVNLCIWLALGVLGEISTKLLLQWLLLLIAGTLALNSVSLLFSILSFKNKKTTSIPILVLIALFAFGPIIGAVAETVEDGEMADFLVNFFNIQIPILYLVSTYVFIVAGWAFVGILRRFSYEYEPLFSQKGCFGFLACYLFLVYALYHKFLFNPEELETQFLYYSFYLVTSFPLIGICLLSLRTFDKYIEITRSSSKKDRVPWKIFLNSNLFSGFLLFLLWALLAGFVSIITNALPDYYKMTMIFLTSWLIILSLIEIYAIYLPNNEKIAYLLLFAAGLYLILPMVLSGIFENESLAMFSPFGMVYSYETHKDLSEILPPFIANVVLLTPLLLMIRVRYSKIAKLRLNIDANP